MCNLGSVPPLLVLLQYMTQGLFHGLQYRRSGSTGVEYVCRKEGMAMIAQGRETERNANFCRLESNFVSIFIMLIQLIQNNNS